ncbi:DNA alkylation repair protein [Luteolibacter sp. Populi]|uniref:DNA alkylation repair protein n=1 Tax=Luteolibacter sp. Populi TaxID=3230487 RepID=UPI003466CE2E
MNAKDVLKELETLGSESVKRLLMKNHGVMEPCFGVKIGDMKPIVKRIKKDYQLALDLYASGNYDAMYLAGLIADDARMTQEDLQRWVDGAYGGSLPGSTVAAVAAQGLHGHEMALKWIDSKKPLIATAGWSTLSCLMALKDDSELDAAELKKLLQRVKKEIHQAPDAARYAMNGFVISLGGYVALLTELAIRTAEEIGPVSVDMGNNSCEVPGAADYIRKMQARGTPGKKRKTVKC